MALRFGMGNSWKTAMKNEFGKRYYEQLCSTLKDKYRDTIPEHDDVFSWSRYFAPEDVNVVILGKSPDPRTEPHGLSFSTKGKIRELTALENVFRALENDKAVEFQKPDHGDLTGWAIQGVLLLNTVLTKGSYSEGIFSPDCDWTNFTDAVISYISTNCDKVVFMLWGNCAKTKRRLIDDKKHLVLSTCSPLPENEGMLEEFRCCNHFSQANYFLQRNKRPTINWSLLLPDLDNAARSRSGSNRQSVSNDNKSEDWGADNPEEGLESEE